MNVYEIFRTIVRKSGAELKFVAHIKSVVDNMLGDEDNSIDDVPDSMLKEYIDMKFGGDWAKAVFELFG